MKDPELIPVTRDEIETTMNLVQQALVDNGKVPFSIPVFIALMGLGIGLLQREGAPNNAIKVLFLKLMEEVTFSEVH